MENPFERGPERIATKESVLEAIARYAQGAHVTKEINDSVGLLRLEAVIPDRDGTLIEFFYLRKNITADPITSKSSIFFTKSEGGIPVTGHNISDYNNETGEWMDIR